MLRVQFVVPVAPGAAFDFIATDYFDHHPLWDPGVLSTAALASGPVRAGMRGTETRRFLGTQTTTFEITELTPKRRLVLHDDPHVWTLTRTYQIAPHGQGATVTFDFDMSPRAWWFRLVHPLVRPLIQRQVRANMARLRTLLEGQVPPGMRDTSE